MKFIPLNDRLHNYLLSVTLREHPLLKELRHETANHARGNMQIAPEQGQLMALLIQLIGAKKTLEVGVFTGYSSLSVALALPEDGKVIACDVSEEYTSIARRYWEKAEVAHKIDLYIAPAIQTLDRLLTEGQANTFDFAFIDADKTGYAEYFNILLPLVRANGFILADNIFFHGQALVDPVKGKNAQAMRAFVEAVHQSTAVEQVPLPLRDGLMLIRKK